MIGNCGGALYELIRAPNQASEAHGNEHKIEHAKRVLALTFKNAPLSFSDQVSYGNVGAEQTLTAVKTELLVPTIYVLS
jgi:hypothetical protein